MEQDRKDCESHLFFYAQVIFPDRYFGDVHREYFNFFQSSLESAIEKGRETNDAALMPRDHQKSFCLAVAVSWAVTKYPWFTVAYVSSNPQLAQDQLGVIKNIFQSEIHRELWPLMLNYVKGRTGEYEHKPKGTWTQDGIDVDHPERPLGEKDRTIKATSARSTNTGGHYKLIAFDDLVTDENYDSQAGRDEIKRAYRSFSKIATTGSIKWMVGTRYLPNDLYGELKETFVPIHDEVGNVIEEKPLWNWFEKVVEDSKYFDGSGTFLWPRTQMPDGKWYGFDRQILSTKRAESLGDESLYGGQYYNNPEVGTANKIAKSNFMYIQPNLLENRQNKWFYGNKELKLACGMDLAFSEAGNKKQQKKRDHTAIAVIAWDAEGYLYILALERFQTAKAEVYYDKLQELHTYWDFREATVETNAGGAVVANYIQDEIRKEGHTLVIKHQHKNQREGLKEERNSQLFEPLYRQKSVYHTKGGYTRLLEEELTLAKPSHDDLMDAVWIAVSNSKRLAKPKFATNKNERSVVNASNRFLSRRKRA
jgi:hypothetical protein